MSYEDYPIPHDIETEQAILGRTICPQQELENIGILQSTADVNDFYLEKHKKIYSAMLELCCEGVEVDLLTLRDKLEEMEALEEVGGSSYLTYLVEVSRSI